MVELLKKLSSQNGVSGNEHDVRSSILQYIKPLSDDVNVDTMGNVIALKKGKNSKKKIAVTVNMDEVGFIVSGITDKGFLKFKTVGNIDLRKVISKRVLIGKNDVKGVIGMKAIHLQTRSERDEVVKASKLFIDIGAEDKETAEKYVKLGDYVTFDTEFMQFTHNVKGKAIDRSGACVSAIEAMNGNYENDVYFCFLTQSLVGSRGAKIVSHRINADVVLNVSAVETNDMYGTDETGVKLGEGIVCEVMSATVISDAEQTNKMLESANANSIKTQTAVVKNHISDGGAFQQSTGGATCINASIPCRYLHSPVSIMSLDDIKETTKYIKLFLNQNGEII